MSNHSMTQIPERVSPTPADRVLQRQNVTGQHAAITSGKGKDVQSLVQGVLNSPGQPLDANTRAFMEPRFGYDFSGVRVHSDAQAAESARVVNARAYTTGRDIVLGAGQFAPGTSSGQRLLAHELTHVVQQAQGPVAGTPIGNGVLVSHPGDMHERSAEVTASRIAGNYDAAAPNNHSLMTLPGPTQSGATFLQRDTSADVGTAFGVIGGVFGIGAFVLGLIAYLRPPAALQPPPLTGGFSTTPAAFGPYNAQPAPQPTSPAPRRGGHSQPPPSPPPYSVKTIPLFKVQEGDRNTATADLVMRSDGHNIASGLTRRGTVTGYPGGSRAANASVAFGAYQSNDVGNKAVATITFEGSNTPDANTIQMFSGRVGVNAEGNVIFAQATQDQSGDGAVETATGGTSAVIIKHRVSGIRPNPGASQGTDPDLAPAPGPTPPPTRG